MINLSLIKLYLGNREFVLFHCLDPQPNMWLPSMEDAILVCSPGVPWSHDLKHTSSPTRDRDTKSTTSSLQGGGKLSRAMLVTLTQTYWTSVRLGN